MKRLLLILCLALGRTGWGTGDCPERSYVNGLELNALFQYSVRAAYRWGQESNAVFERLLEDQSLNPTARLDFFRATVRSRWPESALVYNDHFLDALLTLDVRSVTHRVAQAQGDYGRELIWQTADSHDIPQTSYWNFKQKFAKIPLEDGDLIVDIGAGFSRLGLFLGANYPGVRFRGYEIVAERVQEFHDARDRLGLPKTLQAVVQDLSDRTFVLPRAKVYYAYAPVNADTGDWLWEQLRQRAQTEAFYFVGSLPGRLSPLLQAGAVDFMETVDRDLQIYRSVPR